VQSAMATMTRAREEASPSQMLATINQVIFDNVARRLDRKEYVTMTLLAYTDDGRVSFAGAHQRILVCRKLTGKVERLGTPGMWLGVRAEIASLLVDGEFVLSPGDTLVLFTDGVIECRNDAGEQLDIERLCSLIAQNRDAPVAQIRDAVLGEARRWSRTQDDDRTVVVARYAPDSDR
jgi:sigma-B regulation protein RsbU (phosphoserine phosphatase)